MPAKTKIPGFDADLLDPVRDAMVQTTHVAQEITNQNIDFAKASFERSVASLEKLMTAKSVEDVIAVQSDYARQAYEAANTHAGLLAEHARKAMAFSFGAKA